MGITFLFPGQGSQFPGMGKEFYSKYPLIRELFEAASDRLKLDFPKLMFNDSPQLNQSRYTQPAILLFSASLFKLLEAQLGELQWSFGVGHSLGEFSALVGAGGLELVDGVELVHKRGILMEEVFRDRAGSMLVVLGLSDQEVEEICRESGLQIYPANYNCDGQVVVAGYRDQLEKALPLFKERGAKRALLLNMSVASHAPILEPAVEPLRQLLEEYLAPQFGRVVSNVTAEPYQTREEGLELLPVQLTKPVRYKESIKRVEPETELFIEFGGKVLTGLNRKITKKRTYPVVDLPSFEKVGELLASYEG